MKTRVSKLLVAVVTMASFVACTKDTATAIDTSNNGTFKVFTQGNITTVQNVQADTILGIPPMATFWFW